MSTTPTSKVWLITGSSRGFGRSLAESVLEHGERQVATARHPEQLSDLVTRSGAQVRAVPLDVTNAEQAHAAVRAHRAILLDWGSDRRCGNGCLQYGEVGGRRRLRGARA